jgi:hypothetical protein
LRALTFATLLVLAAAPVAQADEPVLPTCTALVPRLQDDPSSLRGKLRVLSVDHIVEDMTSTQDARVCTGVAQYRDATTHMTWTGTWEDAKHTSFDVNGHDTTDQEAESRARSIRVRTHPPGLDGTFLVRTVVPLCADQDFDRLAENELRVGISFRQSFFREPDYHILSMDSNGYGSGVVINCVATIGNANRKGEIFIGTQWADADGRKYEFYLLSPGPDGFAVPNRLWEIGTE